MLPAAVPRVPFTGFELPVEVLVLGVITGLTYALLGVGLSLTYKSSRVLNLAHGEMGALAARLIPVLVFNYGLSYWPALLAALAVAAAAGALVELVVIRRLAHAPRLIALVATIGLAQALFSLSLFLPRLSETTYRIFPTPFQASVTLGNLRLSSGHLLILAVVPAVTAGLASFLRRSDVGLASRALAENLEAAQLAGAPVRRISLAVWMLAGLLAGVAAVLIGPTRPVATAGTQVALGPDLMLRAFAAAMLGGLTSLPRVFVGGIAIGLVEALVAWNRPGGGLLELILFGFILVSMLLQRNLGRLARGGEESSWSLTGSLRALPSKVAAHPKVKAFRRSGFVLLGVATVLVPVLAGNSLRVRAASVVIFAMMALSLVVLTGMAGQVSLGQFAFVGLGALVGGRAADLGYPPGMGILYAALAGGVAALVIGVPALRIRGLFLAVTTLGFAVASSAWLFSQRWLVRVEGARSSLAIPRPRLLGVDFQSELRYYWLCLAALIAVGAIVHRVGRTGVGRVIVAVRDNEPAAAALSVVPWRVKLVAFVLSGVIAAVAGYFYGGLFVRFPDLAIFGPSESLQLMALALIGGVTTVTGAVLGALFVHGLPVFLDPVLGDLVGPRNQFLLSGLGLLVVVLQFPGGMAAEAFRLRDRIVRRLTGEVSVDGIEGTDGRQAASPIRLSSRTVDAATGDAPLPIEAVDVVVRFGGNVAVDGVTLHASHGEILGLMGPNGAGKTTLFDVLSGQVRPSSGLVMLDGADVSNLAPERRAQLGLGRSFQQARLFSEMALVDVFKVALEREEPSEVVPSLLAFPPSIEAEWRKDLKAKELLDVLGLDPFAERPVRELSTGVRRIAELGCIVALGSRVLLLDEPTAGIAQRDVEAFGPVLREIRAHLGATMIVIDHDVRMMMDLVDRMYVLVSGKVIAEGDPARIRSDPAVVAAFLGTDERVIHRSGAMAVVADRPPSGRPDGGARP